MARVPANVDNFVSFMKQYGFDSIDINCEYGKILFSYQTLLSRGSLIMTRDTVNYVKL